LAVVTVAVLLGFSDAGTRLVANFVNRILRPKAEEDD
jgi:hypothetical protein